MVQNETQERPFDLKSLCLGSNENVWTLTGDILMETINEDVIFLNFGCKKIVNQV